MNRLKYIILTVSIIIITLSSAAQTPQNVDLATGRINIVIPLFIYENSSQRLSMDVSINYNTAGIKVDDIASEVGTGWMLNAGGFIRRNMMGGLDDKYPEGTMYQSGINTSNMDAFVPNGSSPQVDNTYKDNELDVFEFSFNGHHGTFIIGRNKEIIQHVDSKMKISFSESDMSSQKIVTRISKFTIITEDGIVYTFDKIETTRRIYSTVSTYKDNGHQPTTTSTDRAFPKPEGYPPQAFTSAWYLSSVANPLTGKSIQFDYASIHTFKKIAQDETNTTINTGNNAQNHTTTTVIEDITYPRLTKIAFPDRCNLLLNYENDKRLDYGTYNLDYGLTDNALASIVIQKEMRTYKEYDFSYKYFYKNSEITYSDAYTVNSDVTDWDAPPIRNYLRLALKEIQMKNNEKIFPSYKFSYNLWSGSSGPLGAGDIVPPRLTNERNGYGYYYPKASGGDYLVLQNGLLQKMQYPSGGYIEFSYRSNEPVFSAGIGLERNGASVIKSVMYDGINHDNDNTLEYNYVLHDKDGNILVDNLNKEVSSQYGIQPSVTAYQKSSFVETVGSPTVDQVALVLGNLYGKTVLPEVIVSVVHKIVNFFIGSSFRTIDYQINKIGGSFNNNKFPPRFSEVEVVSKSLSASLGKTLYTFTSFDDVPPLFSNQSPPYSQKQVSPDWCYGHPKQIKVYNVSGELVKEVNYTYNFIYRVLNVVSWYESADIEPFRVLAVKASNFATYQSQIAWQSDYYYPITGRIELKSKDEKNYFSDRKYEENQIYYEYDPNSYLPKKQLSTNSTGETIEKRIYYPGDYSITGPIQSMKDKNMVAFPVATESWAYSGTGEQKIVDGAITEYQALANGDIKPVKTYRLQSAKPLPASVIGVFNSSQLNRNTNYFKEDGILAYDAGGALSQTYTRGKTVSRINGYDYQYAIATVKNASANEIAYTSFETDEKGNWQYAGTPDPVNPTVSFTITGERYYDLSKGSLTKSVQGLTNGKQYKLSYWTKNSSAFSVNYASTVIQGMTTGGWTFFEHLFTTGSVDVVLSGSGLVDEVRLYPADAQMVTAAYKPLTGKLSECDVSGKPLYYQYDEFGRRLFVLDENRNIIQKISYHEPGQVQSNSVFYNTQKEQSFIKNNCAPGYDGSSVTYAVPEKKYLSTVSQLAADAQAQEELDAKGQDFANIRGGCTLGNVVAIIGSEYLGTAYSITFTNSNNSSLSYSFGLGVNCRDCNLGTIPLGTYNIKVCPLFNTSNSFSFLINSVYTSGVGCHNYTNMNLTTPGNIIVNDF